MRLIRSFRVGEHVEPDGAGAVVREVLRDRGFREPRGDGEHYVRGSWFSTATAFDPSQWRVRAGVWLEAEPGTGPGGELRLELLVSTTGQIVTPRERDYFVLLIDEIEHDLRRTLGPWRRLSGPEVPGDGGGQQAWEQSGGALVQHRGERSALQARAATRQNIGVFLLGWSIWVASFLVIHAIFPLPLLISAVIGGVPAMAVCFWLMSRS